MSWQKIRLAFFTLLLFGLMLFSFKRDNQPKKVWDVDSAWDQLKKFTMEEMKSAQYWDQYYKGETKI